MYNPVPTREEDMIVPRCNTKGLLRRRLPIVAWLPAYTWSDLLQDFLAGFTVGLTAIPQGIAYAVVAGLPTQYGLYSSFVGCFVYVVFGSSKDVTVGPTAIMALMTQEYASKLDEDFTVLLTFLSGCVILVLGLLHLGFVVDFISAPVTAGFTNAAALIIAASQLKNLLGLAGDSDTFVDSVVLVAKNVSNVVLWDTVLGVVTVLCLVGLKSLPGRKDGTPVRKLMWLLTLARNAEMVIAGTALAYALSSYDLRPFRLTGHTVPGLPPFGLPPFSTTRGNVTHGFLEMTSALGSGLVSLPLLAVLENIAIAKAFAKGKSLDATQEMLAIGLCNILGSFVRSMPTTGSFTRTAVNNASGVKTPLGGVFTGALVLLACGLLTSAFEFIPKATLAAVIIVAMYGMFELEIFRIVWRSKKVDLLLMAVTMLSCLALGLEYGMIVGIVLNLIVPLYFAARPDISMGLEKANGVTFLLVIPRQSLSFPAAEYLREEIVLRCENGGDTVPVVLNGNHMRRIDATVAKNLKYLRQDLAFRGQKLIFWNWCEGARKTLERYDPALAVHFVSSEDLTQVDLDSNLRGEETRPAV